jgi:hypothetical protein
MVEMGICGKGAQGKKLSALLDRIGQDVAGQVDDDREEPWEWVRKSETPPKEEGGWVLSVVLPDDMVAAVDAACEADDSVLGYGNTDIG